MSIRVVCQQCQAKMDIKEDLAGSTRKCPKCKTEFTVPQPEEDDGIVLVESDSSTETVVDDVRAETADVKAISPQEKPKQSASAATARSKLPIDDDDDESDDFIPSFMTSKKESTAGKTPLPPTKTEDDDEPVLSIPKIPTTAKPKFKAFDPDEFADDEPPRPRKREIPASLQETRPQRKRPDEDSSDFDAAPSRGSKSPRGGSGFNLPRPENTGLSDPATPATGGTKDRAQAARELRQALKDSTLRAPQETETTRSISVDLSGLASEIGLKGLAIILGMVILLPAFYFLGSRMMGGGLKIPKLAYVTGKITYNGQPAPGAQVFFEPRDDAGNKLKETRTSFGVADDKGEYKLIYMEGVDGVAIGKSRVWLQLPPPMKTPGEFSQASITLKDVASGSQKIDFPVQAAEKGR